MYEALKCLVHMNLKSHGHGVIIEQTKNFIKTKGNV